MSILRVGGQLARANGGLARVDDPGPGSPSSLDILTADDLTYAGGLRVQNMFYPTSAMTIRWRDSSGDPVYGREPSLALGDVRHFLMFSSPFDAGGNAWHLIEYKEVAAKSTSAPTYSSSTWPGFPALTETRRWFDWHNYDTVAAAFPGIMGAVMYPSSFRWEPGTTASNGRLWFTWVPTYPGSSQPFANIQYAVLDDSEARTAGATSGVTVSSGNKPKYLYYKDTGFSWKKATSGLTEIPADRQADFGGNKFLFAGSNQGNIDNGARGLDLSVVAALPTSSPTQGDTILAGSTLILDTGSDSTASVVNLWRPQNLAKFPGHNYPNLTMHVVTSGGAYTAYTIGDPLPLGVGDCVYFGQYDNAIGGDVIEVRMNSGASGGSFVIERYNGSSWVEPADLAIHLGTRAMSAANNVFYFDHVLSSSSTPHASMGANYWWRLRRTVAGSSGGAFGGIHVTDSPDEGSSGGASARPFTAYIEDHADAIAAYNADPANYHAYAYAPDMVDGTAFVRTNAVEGVVFAARFSTRAAWYGASLLYARPDKNNGAPVAFIDSLLGATMGNGNWASGVYQFYLGVFDADQLAEAYAGTRDRNADGIHPVAYYLMRDHFPTLPLLWTGASGSTDDGVPLDRQTAMNQAMIFDPLHKQLIYMFHWEASPEPFLLFFDVRDS